MVSLINCMTSFFAGFTVFSMMGFMARLLKTEVGDAVKGGKVSAVSHKFLKSAYDTKVFALVSCSWISIKKKTINPHKVQVTVNSCL